MFAIAKFKYLKYKSRPTLMTTGIQRKTLFHLFNLLMSKENK